MIARTGLTSESCFVEICVKGVVNRNIDDYCHSGDIITHQRSDKKAVRIEENKSDLIVNIILDENGTIGCVENGFLCCNWSESKCFGARF